MPMELRKRKAPAEPAQQAAPKKRTSRAGANTTAKKAKTEETKASETPAAPSKRPAVGDTIDLGDFQDEITFQDGTSTSLKALVAESKSGVVLFTYPRASTPGCKCMICASRRVAFLIADIHETDPGFNVRYQPSLSLPR